MQADMPLSTHIFAHSLVPFTHYLLHAIETRRRNLQSTIEVDLYIAAIFLLRNTNGMTISTVMFLRVVAPFYISSNTFYYAIS